MRRAAVAVCNGGSPACQQALAAGVPVVGLPGNLDQLLNMHFMVRAQAAVAVRPERASVPRLRSACERALYAPELRAGARAAQAVYARYDAARALEAALDGLLGQRRGQRAGQG
jgi:UDP:flavonoid glycosyltransferase YjiC (YdhE family)